MESVGSGGALPPITVTIEETQRAPASVEARIEAVAAASLSTAHSSAVERPRTPELKKRSAVPCPPAPVQGYIERYDHFMGRWEFEQRESSDFDDSAPPAQRQRII